MTHLFIAFILLSGTSVLAFVIYFLFVRANKSALLVIDVQNDFCPGGALAVPDGDSIIHIINKWIGLFTFNKRLIVFSMDFHPQYTDHFKKWPPHCIGGTDGAKFHKDLTLPHNKHILVKGRGDRDDAYSAFDKNGRVKEVNLHTFLKANRVKSLLVCGLATDYCVKATVLDALQFGYEVILLTDAIKSVEEHPGDGQKAIDEMVAHGAKLYSDTK